MSGAAAALTSASLSLRTIVGGVPRGAAHPFHVVTS